jgi:KDO2-lipid IV(A) lauroyltransferase
MFQRIIFYFFRLAIGFVSLLPFSVLYRISDGLTIVFQYFIRYRRKVVETNLRKSFPEKSDVEIKVIIKQFYQHFADIVLEGMKGYTVSPEKLFPRYQFLPSKTLENYYKNNQSVVFVGGHYGNWEWGVMCGGLQLQHPIMCYYHPIHNQFIDNYYRKQFSSNRNLTPIPSKKAVRNFVQTRHETVGHLLIADQSPKSRKNAIWLEFLHQDTICIIGPEKLARQFNYPVFYIQIKRIKRGYYEVEFVEFEANPKTTKEGEITAKFMKMLEQQIIEKPHEWLWSHRRWKKKR